MNIKKIEYKVLRGSFCLVRDKLLDLEVTRETEEPEQPYVMIPHHCTGFDGVLMHTLTERQSHFWVQFENVFDSRWKRFLEFIGEIPIKVNGEKDRKNIREAINQSRSYLSQPNQVVGFFNDGPSARLSVDGRILELEERPNYSGGAHIGQLTGAPIVPVSIWCPPDFQKKYWAWKTNLQGTDEQVNIIQAPDNAERKRHLGGKFIELLVERLNGKAMPYKVFFGAPIEPIRNKEALVAKIRDEQVRNYKTLAGQ